MLSIGGEGVTIIRNSTVKQESEASKARRRNVMSFILKISANKNSIKRSFMINN